jgi:DnaJ like chaperone protein
MGKFGKWIAGGLGWAFFGPIGGILGFAVGALLEETPTTSSGLRGKTTTGDFAMSLLVLIAAVMKADGTVRRSELDFVKSYLVRSFGEDSAREALAMLKNILKQDIPLQDVCRQIQKHMNYSTRLQLLHLLYGISAADDRVNEHELRLIDTIAASMGISSKDQESVKYMFVPKTDAFYKILEIPSSATNEEVKQAYRKMAMKYHPDKVSHLGEDFQKFANEKFKKVNEAYNQIKKERSMN